MDTKTHVIVSQIISDTFELGLTEKEVSIWGTAPDLDCSEGIHRLTWHRSSKFNELYEKLKEEHGIDTKQDHAYLLILSHIWLDMFTAPVFIAPLNPSFYWKLRRVLNREWIGDLHDITFLYEEHNTFHMKLSLFFRSEFEHFSDFISISTLANFLVADLNKKRIFSRNKNSSKLSIDFANLLLEYTDTI